MSARFSAVGKLTKTLKQFPDSYRLESCPSSQSVRQEPDRHREQ